MAKKNTSVNGQGSNSVQLRHFNERVVLDVFRQLGQASKAEVARAAHLTPPAVAGIVDRLEHNQLIMQIGKKFGSIGQPSVLYKLNPSGAYTLGLHIGRRSFDAVLMDFEGQRVAERTYQYPYPHPAEVKALGEKTLAELLDSLGEAKDKVVGIGIAAPYFMGGWGDDLGFTAEIAAQWQAIDLRTFFTLPAIPGLTQPLPVFTENDASAAAVAELVHGIGQQHRDFLYLCVSTLIGGGLVLDGTLQSGPNGNTAAYGPFPVTPSRLSSVEKPKGPFEQLLRRASVNVLTHHLHKHGYHIERWDDPALAAPEVQKLVAEWQEDCGEALAQAIIGSIAVVDVNAVVIDGILPTAMMDAMRQQLQHFFALYLPKGLLAPEILPGHSGVWGPAIGASILPLHALFGPDRGILTKNAAEKKPLMIGAAQ